MLAEKARIYSVFLYLLTMLAKKKIHRQRKLYVFPTLLYYIGEK